MSIRRRIFTVSLAIALLTLRTYAAPVGIMVAAYFTPSSGYWASMNYAASRIPLIAIMNANNGPGTSQSSSYITALAQLHLAGGKITGYIYTSYGARPLADVEADIDRYLAWYAVDGFFVDEMTNDADINHINYYAALYNYIKAKGANYSVTGNPGSNTQESYITRPTDDSLMIFESESAKYAAYAPSSWVSNYSPDHFVHLPYGAVGTTTMSNYVALAVQRNAGWIYISDLTTYSKLPTYWTNEVLMLQAFNQGTLAPFLLDTTQPADQTASAGGSVTFNVSAFGSSNLSYQWFSGSNAIPNATNASYHLASIQATNTSLYHVTVTNTNGIATSRSASLTISNTPSTFKKITIDGAFNDWNGVPLAYTGVIGPATAIQYKDIYLANDQSNLYIHVTLYSPRANSFANSYDNIFIDADNNVATGYHVHGVGSSLLIQSGSGYQEKNGGFNEGAVNNLGWSIARSADGTECEIAISRNATYASDSSLVFANNLIAFLFQGDDTSHSNVEDVPSATGIVYSFASQPQALGPLSISYAAGNIVTSWTGSGTLQSRASFASNDVWTNLPGATSPYTITASNTQQFFRLIQ